MNGKEFLEWQDKYNNPVSKEARKIIGEFNKAFNGQEDVSEGMEQDGSLSEVDAATKIQILVFDPIPEDKSMVRREVIIKILTDHNIIRILGNASRYSPTNQLFEEFLTEKIIQVHLNEVDTAVEFCKRYMAGDEKLQEWLDKVLPR